jgi:transcriptional regulator with XRE-family HTH domain
MTRVIPHLLSPIEIQKLLGRRLKALRLQSGFKRTTLAERSGVSARSLQRFEDTGEVSLKNLLRLVNALGRLPEFAELLDLPEARSLEELEARDKKATPKRGRI